MTEKTLCLKSAGALAILGIALSLGGCASRPPDELAQAIATGERPVAMKGTGVFFGGKLSATVTISRGIGKGTPGGASGKMPRQLGTDLMSVEETEVYTRTKAQIGSPLPPVTLHLRIENLLKTTLLVEVLDFNSDLGNFAPQPPILALAPEQVAEPEPMISQLGVTSDAIPVLVTLRMDGKKESQTIMVKNLALKTAADDEDDEESRVTRQLRAQAKRDDWTPAASSNP